MKTAAPMQLSDGDKNKIHEGVLQIFEEIGIKVESKSMLKKLEEFGGIVDYNSEIVRFSKKVIQEFIDQAGPFKDEDSTPSVSCGLEIFSGKYLNPETGAFDDWNEENLKSCVRVANALPTFDSIGMLCCPFNNIPGEIHTVYSKYLNWKLGMSGINNALHGEGMLPFIEEFHQVRSETLGIDIKKSMRGFVFMISPLTLPRIEADIYEYCAERRYHCGISVMISTGGSAPVTIPGAVAQHLAEWIFGSILHQIYYKKKPLYLGYSISSLDMKRGGFCYGRPEKAVANSMYYQMATDFYHGETAGATGFSDAKTPGSDASAQKLITAMSSLMQTGKCSIAGGLLSVDEIVSPIQMILDNEMVLAMRRLIQPEPVNDDTLAIDVIKEAGHGGIFTDKMHTAMNFREAIWDSGLWTSDLYSGWAANGSKSIEELALEKWRELNNAPDPESTMTPEAEEKVKDILNRALKSV